MAPSPAFQTVELDELTVTVVADNASDTLSSVAPGIPQIPEMAHLLEGPVIGTYDGHDMVVILDRLCVACHGFSAIATARVGDRSATVLFDVGPYGDVWLANARRLEIDLSGIDVLFLSHWHWDHTGGVPAVVAAIAAERQRAGRPPTRRRPAPGPAGPARDNLPGREVRDAAAGAGPRRDRVGRRHDRGALRRASGGGLPLPEQRRHPAHDR
jgi:glyoxylase-like metal-dependent hydrolase (beta-lactamase superfamily II)